ncbi:hypothetical protein EYZ11_003828 [Aspergillus tanneri]|uniref:Enoyl reductase (ER) domain-containing protein n=1 Tax=Aspergillus tanneri TaxID=1220188 RepID=A0A4S3JME6_9EURO|nr:hypothetical protein EYZ11_003828 [Aspergillus tanneri]
MPSRTAVQIISSGVVGIRIIPAPGIRDGYIIAETRAFALNPTDCHHVDGLGGPGTIVGCDWSGVVKEVDRDVTRSKKGDEVYGICHGDIGNTVELEDGAYADIIACKEHAEFHKPKDLSFEEAASLVAALVTAAKLSGCRVYAVCSPSNFDLVKSRGADHWFDCNVPECVEQIQSVAGSSITYFVDCVGSQESSNFCGKVLSPAGGHNLKAPLPESFKALRPEEAAIAMTAIAYTLLGETFELPGGIVFPADKDEEAFAKKWAVVIEKLVLSQYIRPHPVDIRQGGGVGRNTRGLG